MGKTATQVEDKGSIRNAYREYSDQGERKWTDWKKGHENMKYQWSMTNVRSNEVNHRTKRMYRMLIFAAFLILHSSFLVSCSESDNSVEE